MLVYCMFLDEHVNHEPQFILYFQNKLTLQSGINIIWLNACWFQFSFISCWFQFCSLLQSSVQCVHHSLRMMHEVCNRKFQRAKKLIDCSRFAAFKLQKQMTVFSFFSNAIELLCWSFSVNYSSLHYSIIENNEWKASFYLFFFAFSAYRGQETWGNLNSCCSSI